MLHVKRAAIIIISELYLLCDMCSNRLEYGYESNVMWLRIESRVEPIPASKSKRGSFQVFIVFVFLTDGMA